MPIVKLFDGCQDKSEEYREGYLHALLSEMPDAPFMGRTDYLTGYADASTRRDKARNAQLELKFSP